MTDLISRADAIAYIDRIINSGLGRNKSLDYIHKYISLLPSADAVSREEYEDIIKDYRKQYENMNNEIADLEIKLSAEAEWIPCSERLPNEDEKVLVSGEAITEEILISKGEYVGYWHNKGFSLAWQPLPKPYKGGAK